MKKVTVSEQIASNGEYKDLGEYQKLKESKEMEIAGTRQLYEHLKRQHGDTVARQMLKRKGYDAALLRN